MLKKTESNEWIDTSISPYKVGFSKVVVESIGNIVFFAVDEINKPLKKGDRIGCVESNKAAVDLYIPLNGKIVSVNQDVVENPGLINSDPFVNWLFKVEVPDLKEINSMASFTNE